MKYATRSCAAKPVSELDLEVLLDDATEQSCYGVYEAIQVAFQRLKNNPNDIAEFFMGPSEDTISNYDFNDPMHRYVVAVVVEKVTAQHPTAFAFINKIVSTSPATTLRDLGINAYTKGDKTFYRIRVGSTTYF
jgi:hypothetical protein